MSLPLHPFTISHFIARFEAIPEDRWCEYELIDRQGRRCAIGHLHGSKLNMHRDDLTARCGKDETDESRAFAGPIKLRGISISDVNDGRDSHYQQSTPKARVLACLNDLL